MQCGAVRWSWLAIGELLKGNGQNGRGGWAQKDNEWNPEQVGLIMK